MSEKRPGGAFQIEKQSADKSKTEFLTSKEESDTETSGISVSQQLQPQVATATSALSEGNPLAAEYEHGQAAPVIAVSASKSHAAFFNLARKFLATNEICDLSALEGAIVSAVEAANLLERSKLATIARIQTSYVPVEPKKKRAESPQVVNLSSGTIGSRKLEAAVTPQGETSVISTEHLPLAVAKAADSSGTSGSPSRVHSSGREMRRARIVITLKRTPEYSQWLIENPQSLEVAVEEVDEELEGEEEVTAASEQGPTRESK
mmetsp:Transcript_20709/g.29524  ORF Transcript_20709/g.29524 Transcript_20709/m.29524 type:complete len:263 (-) Transcript_20709:607-1395(-)|eukprot:CAMPEP_0172417664 /NCGR_PEP_ID=MMETSP1064-20121228/4192_1 /TAXON_ID=202472 /ORGANISM="Aulacoseira subarctica , Strain CCAP 1002/5" /LENGTH=262 /DNA_ID=CAMNT_0013156153 /DNA_START=238 /DNA_END=1026 /DNA_ORIENTATION=-